MQDTPTSPLVLTKLRAPSRRPRIIQRSRLIDLLSPDNVTDVILVCAPAGYGKTTLLTEWAQSLIKSGTAVAWYSLDAGDDDPIPFGAYLIASFIQAMGPGSEFTQIAQRLRSSPELDLQRILPDLINALISNGQNCVVILDDYHLIRSPAIHSAIAYLIEHLPDNLQIAIGSRSDPPLPMARLRARGQLLEIRTANLRFTAEEAGQFLNKAMGLELPQAGISALEERTEGWIAGLQLASLSLQVPPIQSNQPEKETFLSAETFLTSFTGSHRYLVEYLLEEVFNHQSKEVQSFLLSTSILERMCAPLCAVLPDANPHTDTALDRTTRSEEILHYLEKANLFVVALDDQGYWYRYHHLFRDFLRARLNKLYPEQSAGLHSAASDWLARNGLLREACAHAFQTLDWNIAAAFVEQNSFTLIVHSEISTIFEWCSAFPEEVMQVHPMLCALQGLALAYNFRRKNRARVEARLLQTDRLIAAMEDRQRAQGLMELAAVVRTFLAMAPDPAADALGLLTLSKRILEHYPQNDPGQFSPLLLTGYASMAILDVKAAEQAFESARLLALQGSLYFGLVESTFHLARLAHSQGQLHRAVEICQQGLSDLAAILPHAEQELPALGCLEIELGCVLLEQNQLAEAEKHLQQGLNQMGAGMNPHYLMMAYLALFRLYEILGQSTEATKYLDRLESLWPDIAFCTRGLRIAHALRTSAGDPDILAEASEWCRDFPPVEDPGMGPIGAADAYYLASLTWIRIQIATGKALFAEPYLVRQMNLASAHGLVNRVIELSLLEAELAAKLPEAQDYNQRVWPALERALAAAKPESYMRIFDQGISLTQLLIEAADHGIDLLYLKQILAVITLPKRGDPENSAFGARSVQVSGLVLTETLSERELEVLRLIAHGATNQAIAERLVITVGTVKSHINHILGKLDAQNRTEAVAHAQELGLLKI